MVTERLRGLLTALITPFDARGEVDKLALKRLVNAQIDSGVDGLVPCGTTGETANLTAEEQETVVRTVIECAAGRVPVVVGTGGNSSRVTVAQTNRAKDWGADVALVVSPYYNKPTQEGIYAHYKAVASDGGLPVVAYNVPGRTSSDISAETVARLASEGLIVGIKDATGDMNRISETNSLIPESTRLCQLSGDDFTVFPFMACGGTGAISVVSNLCPRDMKGLLQATIDGDLALAREIHQRLWKLTTAIFSVPNPMGIKAALSLTDWCRDGLRLPMVTASETVRERIRQALSEYTGHNEDLRDFMA